MRTEKCGARWDPEGDHPKGYRCTLDKGHKGDHEAHGPTGIWLHAWSRHEGIEQPKGDA